MNLWDCMRHGCGIQATGTGGAIGLRAIGWYFEAGQLYCPAHWPNRPEGCGKFPAVDGSTAKPETCSQCASEEAAEHLQQVIAREVQQGHPALQPTEYETVHTWESSPEHSKCPRVTLQLVTHVGEPFVGEDPDNRHRFYILTDHSTGHWMRLQTDCLLPAFAALAETSEWLRYVMGPFYRQMRRELQNAALGHPTQEGRRPFEGGRPDHRDADA